MKNLCRDCKKRHLGCHSHCESYLKFKKELELVKNELEEENKYIGYLASSDGAYERMGKRR